jgi:hypothetical protein
MRMLGEEVVEMSFFAYFPRNIVSHQLCRAGGGEIALTARMLQCIVD